MPRKPWIHSARILRTAKPRRSPREDLDPEGFELLQAFGTWIIDNYETFKGFWKVMEKYSDEQLDEARIFKMLLPEPSTGRTKVLERDLKVLSIALPLDVKLTMRSRASAAVTAEQLCSASTARKTATEKTVVAEKSDSTEKTAEEHWCWTGSYHGSCPLGYDATVGPKTASRTKSTIHKESYQR
eukprot:Skav216202  [mRNA]  locus=scaffold238:77817:81159:- [translate_table: standard]